ncbi:MAG: T9SS type A sorting domain-containing protein, partial [Ignavibacteriales bacterium]|nr:T9SS type A sorting domain-containing protein [Ignavibacteriales bacterium]
TAPANANAVSVRARSWHLWACVSYWDDVQLNLIENVPTGVKERPIASGGSIPTDYSLGQNFPNPFNPATTIRYNLPHSGQVTLEVFNIVGQKVATIVDQVQSAGEWSVRWNGEDASGKLVSTGLYLYRLTAGSYVSTKKMMLIK